MVMVSCILFPFFIISYIINAELLTLFIKRNLGVTVITASRTTELNIAIESDLRDEICDGAIFCLARIHDLPLYRIFIIIVVRGAIIEKANLSGLVFKFLIFFCVNTGIAIFVVKLILVI